MILACRFALFTGDLQNAIRISRKLIKSAQPSTPYELDACAVEHWANLAIMGVSSPEDIDWRYIQSIEGTVRGLGDSADLDLHMLWARSKYLLKKKNDCLNILNKVASTIIFECVTE
jgi:hypothetical protein